VAGSVIDIREVDRFIVQVTMQDRAHKNQFSSDLVAGLIESFAAIKKNQTWKAVILTGYDTYFACGGTRETLLRFTEGRGAFTDKSLYSLALDCDLPVIAAMQGHGIGGGFVFGLFADFVILSRESVYTTNFMKYGFTPGMGATYIVPEKLGIALGTEMLIAARNYRGADLENRNVPFPVLSRSAVLEHALQLAREIAEKPRDALIALKRHLAKKTRANIARTAEEEAMLHEQTFRGPDVVNRINALHVKQ